MSNTRSYSSEGYISESSHFLESPNYKAENSESYSTNEPFLRITEQPQEEFRFRYKSERDGSTHGCLLGRSTVKGGKVYPTVELVNWTKGAMIKCRLIKRDRDEKHPHSLHEEDHNDVSFKVPEKGSYKVCFQGIGVIYTAVKQVVNSLMKSYLDEGQKATKELRERCKREAKDIDLNVVRLRFSAHDLKTDDEICEPVYSELVKHSKSPKTNRLKIVASSLCHGTVAGGDTVMLFVEKVSKTDIEVQFYENDNDGNMIWTKIVHLLPTCIHHQYGIKFSTPSYCNLDIESPVTVYMKLVRPSNGTTSDPMPFKYHPKRTTKRKADSCSCYSSVSDSSSSNDSPMRQNGSQMNNGTHHGYMFPKVLCTSEVSRIEYNGLPVQIIQSDNSVSQPSDSSVVEEFYVLPGSPCHLMDESNNNLPRKESPVLKDVVLSQPNAVSIPNTFYMNTFKSNGLMENPTQSELGQFLNDFDNVSKEWFTILEDEDMTNLTPDSGGRQVVLCSTRQSAPLERKCETKKGDGVPSFTPSVVAEVKKLVIDIYTSMKQRRASKDDLRVKMECLLKYKASDGCTFLHVALAKDPKSLRSIVRLICDIGARHLLNSTNDYGHTVLHQAIQRDLTDMTRYLIDKGCDPMKEDSAGNNAIHCAVICRHASMDSLLQALVDKNIRYDLDAYNIDKQTPLHLAALYNSGSSAAALLERGACYKARDARGRTPLHSAVCNDSLNVAQTLLQYIPPEEIDVVDGDGNTALEIVCGSGVRHHTLTMMELLLRMKADPSKLYRNRRLWRLIMEKPAMRRMMEKYYIGCSSTSTQHGDTSDEYFSADDDYENIASNLQKMYIKNS